MTLKVDPKKQLLDLLYLGELKELRDSLGYDDEINSKNRSKFERKIAKRRSFKELKEKTNALLRKRSYQRTHISPFPPADLEEKVINKIKNSLRKIRINYTKNERDVEKTIVENLSGRITFRNRTLMMQSNYHRELKHEKKFGFKFGKNKFTPDIEYGKKICIEIKYVKGNVTDCISKAIGQGSIYRSQYNYVILAFYDPNKKLDLKEKEEEMLGKNNIYVVIGHGRR